ncbi:MFS transporter [Sphaerisporangium perillae]|uniref:MFS transporter n=1 Tax=Sphaerisporangium perillae TaxID=2935860 RepID=UPI00200ED4BD|nr:MFS transporter [Sphaerisporangium perillae]
MTQPAFPAVNDFRRVWGASALSMVAFRMLGVIYPLLALGVTGSPAVAGWVGFAWTVPGVVLYIPAGVLVDRWTPRAIMLCSETVRAVTAATLCVLLATGSVPLWLIGLAALIEGTSWVFHATAETALVPSLVDRSQLNGAYARTETSAHLAVVVGRSLAGVLLAIGHAWPLGVNAVLFVLSLGMLRRVDGGTRRRAERVSFVAEMVSGVRELTDHPFLRDAMVMTMITNLVVNTLIMVYLTGSAGSPLQVGLVVAAGGVGGAVGSSLTIRYAHDAITLFRQMWVLVLAILVALLGHPTFFALATFMIGYVGALSNIAVRTFEASHIAPGNLAKVAGVSRFAARCAVCAAGPIGGALVAVAGFAGAVRLLAGVVVGIAVVAAFTPWGKRLKTTLSERAPGRQAVIRPTG